MISMVFAHRKALASIVTSTILLSSVAILGVGLVGWSNSNLMNHQKNLESTFSKNVNKFNESVFFENIWFGGTPSKYVNMTITNNGQIGMNVTKIKFTNPADQNVLLSTDITNGGMLTANSYSVQISYEWTSGNAFDIVVDTQRGNIYRTQVSP